MDVYLKNISKDFARFLDKEGVDKAKLGVLMGIVYKNVPIEMKKLHEENEQLNFQLRQN